MRHDIDPGTLTTHKDRSISIASLGFAELLGTLGVERSDSRPRVSNDDPHSEALTRRQSPARLSRRFPQSARCTRLGHRLPRLLQDLSSHCHEGISTRPSAVLRSRRGGCCDPPADLDAAYDRHSEPLVGRSPVAQRPPAVAAINPAPPEATPRATENQTASDSVNLSAPKNQSQNLRASRCPRTRPRSKASGYPGARYTDFTQKMPQHR